MFFPLKNNRRLHVSGPLLCTLPPKTPLSSHRRLMLVFTYVQPCPASNISSILPRRPGLRNRYTPLTFQSKTLRTLFFESSIAPLSPIATSVILPLGSIVVKNYSFSKLEFCYYCLICICVSESRCVQI